MNYKLLYSTLVEKFKTQEIQDGIYAEMHHIVPKHDGGDDSPENLVKVSYRQHRLLHKVRYKAYGQFGDYAACRLMYKIDTDKKKMLCSMAGKIGGKKNAESGHIQFIGKLNFLLNYEERMEHFNKMRLLANNDAQRKHASMLGKKRHENGELLKSLELAWQANQGRVQNQEERDMRSSVAKERLKDTQQMEKLLSAQKTSAENRIKEAAKRSEEILKNAQRNEEWLHKKSSRSEYLFVSPEGLIFESPIFAAKYYGNVSNTVIENWCKRNKYDWYIILKPEEA